ncbi:carboxylesterase BioH (pimeloyl-CoA synthesis) [Nitrosococcus oceani ATCC 19707]|uniref:Pimeloyl-[acyl-carrier protein] methyl ester esterase n=2 Tax=Nitrosococcus oceani TaxID=1229 RepID=Q3J9D7_NITOC|nr:pimeloyl-ACP methyl ester esterase BioH [Nitrosococcus oceani]ABA58559.1 carboxylesterase BioH (pimeloyl-CoA synthesis) [Nitrosococcus oceani ATCC 19707]EDZ68219.1 putative pimeloyl-BioC--CoA transferase BioH [Nitrosococcus oceani AFC27]KFI18982.1 BioH protein [Nitrosococcus oceani C-27]GEM19678.1 pimeloyl-[acyl-carrier protein] methyl ester esterase [Nitrosococcus oceani]
MTLQIVQRGAGPDLVLLHGWGFHSGVWAPLVDCLSTRFRLTLVDLPGHGGSDPLAQGRRLAAVAETVARVAPPQACWLGWSLGGLVALQAAIDFPRRVNKLVLVASTPRFVTAVDWPYGVAPEVLADFSVALQNDSVETLKRFVWLQTRGAERAKAVAQVLLAHFNAPYRPGIEGLEDGLALLQDSDLRVELETIPCPTLAIMGQRDPLVPPKVGAWLSAHLPQGQVFMIPRAGHAPFLSHGQVFKDIVSNFLQA